MYANLYDDEKREYRSKKRGMENEPNCAHSVEDHVEANELVLLGPQLAETLKERLETLKVGAEALIRRRQAEDDGRHLTLVAVGSANEPSDQIAVVQEHALVATAK